MNSTRNSLLVFVFAVLAVCGIAWTPPSPPAAQVPWLATTHLTYSDLASYGDVRDAFDTGYVAQFELGSTACPDGARVVSHEIKLAQDFAGIDFLYFNVGTASNHFKISSYVGMNGVSGYPAPMNFWPGNGQSMFGDVGGDQMYVYIQSPDSYDPIAMTTVEHPLSDLTAGDVTVDVMCLAPGGVL